MTKNDPPRKALGKGLQSLIPKRQPAETLPSNLPADVSPAEERDILRLPIDQITPNPNQPRREFDPTALMELTQSIERDGIIQPIVVRKNGPREFQIIAGERRWRAAKAAGLKEVPVILRVADDQQVLELAIVENIQREDLNPIELALAFHRMAADLGLSHDQIGQKTGKERTTVTNSLRLLQLPEKIQGLVASKHLSAGHARALLKFNDGDLQNDVAQRCIAEGWSVRQIENFTRGPAAAKEKAKPSDKALDPNVKFAVTEMERVLGTKVRIVEGAKGRGRIEIEYYSPDDLSRIYEMMVPPEST
jgi:ParB family chromosome partitioning protein